MHLTASVHRIPAYQVCRHIQTRRKIPPCADERHWTAHSMPILAPVVHPVIFSLRRSNVNRLRPFTLGILTRGIPRSTGHLLSVYKLSKKTDMLELVKRHPRSALGNNLH